MSRSTKIFLAFAVILGAGAMAAVIFANKSPQVSEEFVSSKKQALLIVRELMDISKDSIKNVEQISVLNSERKFEESRQLIQKEFDKNNLIKEKAIRLSDDLAKMAKSAADIKSDKSAEIALRAISVETDLLSHLVVYNDNLNELLGILEMQMNGEKIVLSDVQTLTQRINFESRIVNDLDARFDSLTEEFEKSL